MTTYVDVALEEIREKYPIAYKILKDATIHKSNHNNYEPYYKSSYWGLKGEWVSCKEKNNPQIIINCPDVNNLFNKGVVALEGNLTIGKSSYQLHSIRENCNSSEHQLILELEGIEKE